MARFYDSLNKTHIEFIQKQLLFFVATAPENGRINLSPKGMDTLRVIDPNRVAYLDMTGSGSETSAHLRENGRMTMMLCSFDETPMILRLSGTGRVILPGEGEWNEMIPFFKSYPGQRQIIVLSIDRVQTSCGFGVPVFESGRERDMLTQWAAKRGEKELARYRADKNHTSIDGLPTGF